MQQNLIRVRRQGPTSSTRQGKPIPSTLKLQMSRTKFAKFSWAFLIFIVPVIVWGAFVRASVSGDGCGNNWPGCGGAGIIPNFDQAQTKTIVEFTHRASVAVICLPLLVQLVWCFLIFPKRSPIRKSAVVSSFFIVIEALVGALLVKKGWVGWDDSVQRAVVMGIHLINTFLLLGSLSLTALWASGVKPPTLKGQGAVGWALLIGFVGVILLGIS